MFTVKLSGNRKQKVADYAEASKVVSKWIDDNDLGSSTFNGGEIYDESGTQIAYVSYNGRVWPGTSYDPEAKPLYG